MRGDGFAGRSIVPDIWASPGLRDVQSLAGHATLANSKRYIDESPKPSGGSLQYKAEL